MTRPYEYRPAWFFGLAFLGSWLPWLLGLYLASEPAFARYAALVNFMGLLGPLGATSVLVLTSGNTALQSDLLDRLLQLGRIRPRLALFALAMPVAVISVSIAISLWFGESSEQFGLAGGRDLPSLVILALILAPIYEEAGWHGYGVDSLRARNGMMEASVQFAILWCAWHAPLVLVPGTYQYGLARMDNKIYIANFFFSIIPVAIIANWFYYRNDRSVLASMLLHAMFNAASVLINAGQIAKCIATLVYSAIAIALVLGDQHLFAQGPRNFLKSRLPSSRAY
jgi:membrane protease YdiL (CAAX protease family)